MPSHPSVPTRPSLLTRLRADDDPRGWEEFYRIYGGLLRRFARGRGLTESEAEEVVQETAIGVARNLPGFEYEPDRCSFKSWMLNLASWRIVDALRRRRMPGAAVPGGGRGEHPGTTVLERIPDPHPVEFGARGDAVWALHAREAAWDGLRGELDPLQFQLFDLYVMKGRPAREVAARLGVAVARVYLAKQRVGARLRREVRRLEQEAARWEGG